MRLKSIEIIGFKSFADRLTLELDQGITAIVGPNGCGKSNIVDAIRWAMGEQSAKHLRGEEMQDVIFNGSDSRPPMGMASVTLTFDNSDGIAPAEYSAYTEITVSRRLYRSGESEYYINRTPARLKDITDLFLGTGTGTKAYSIIEQGKVENIINAKEDERRGLIEEAAGTSKFRARKEVALRKMEATQINLDRLTSILDEQERQLNSLARQARKARRYTELRNELTKLELELASFNYAKLADELAALEDKMRLAKEDEAASASALNGENLQIEEGRLKLTLLEKELNAAQEETYNLQNAVRQFEARDEFDTREISDLETKRELLDKRKEELTNKLAARRGEITNTNAQTVELDIQLQGLSEKTSALEEELKSLEGKEQEASNQTTNCNQELISCTSAISASEAETKKISEEVVEITGSIARLQAEIDAIDKRLGLLGSAQEKLAQKDNLLAEINSIKDRCDAIKGGLAHTEAQVSSIEEALSLKRSRLSSLIELKENFENYGEGVRHVMAIKKTGREKRILGTVAEMVTTEPAYETAVGAVLGEKLQYVVVASHDAGVEAIDYLKRESSGRSAFIPLDVRTEPGESPKEDGVIGHMLDFVKFPNDFNKIGEYLFGDVVLVSDLKKALNIWNLNGCKATFVTLDGEVVDPHGVISGGRGGDRQLLSQGREITELGDEAARLTNKVKEGTTNLAHLKNELQVLEAHLTKLDSALHKAELDIVELSHFQSLRDRLTVETAALSEKLSSSGKRKEELAVLIEEARRREDELRKTIVSADKSSDSLAEQEAGLRNEISLKKAELAGILERRANLNRDIERLVSNSLEEELERDKLELEMTLAYQDIEFLKTKLETGKSGLSSSVSRLSELETERHSLKARYDNELETLRNREARLSSLRKRHDETKDLLHQLELETLKLTENIKFISHDISEKYRIDIRLLDTSLRAPDGSEAISINRLSEDQVASHQEAIQSLKDKLEKLGPVSPEVIEEYENLKTRFEFVSKQKKDLENSLAALKSAIVKINETSRKRFAEAFDAINERFQMVFPHLFKGGRAKLVLLNQDDVLESGIDIVAQPPGKKLESIGLLSGGEKALTAAALIFSIFLTKPTPFALLDEIDAPLDDANIDRFNDLIRELRSRSQFILITHNKRTMELADVLYGVTMEEAGVSKMISVKLTGERLKAAA